MFNKLKEDLSGNNRFEEEDLSLNDEYEEYLGGPIRNDINRNISTKMKNRIKEIKLMPDIDRADMFFKMFVSISKVIVFIGFLYLILVIFLNFYGNMEDKNEVFLSEKEKNYVYNTNIHFREVPMTTPTIYACEQNLKFVSCDEHEVDERFGSTIKTVEVTYENIPEEVRKEYKAYLNEELFTYRGNRQDGDMYSINFLNGDVIFVLIKENSVIYGYGRNNGGIYDHLFESEN